MSTRELITGELNTNLASINNEVENLQDLSNKFKNKKSNGSDQILTTTLKRLKEDNFQLVRLFNAVHKGGEIPLD